MNVNTIINSPKTATNQRLQLLFTLTLLLFSIIGFAQESFTALAQGNFFANGTIGVISTNEKAKFEGSTSDVGSTFQITATPKGGYFITDNIAAGLELEVRTSTSKIEGFDGETTSNAFAVGPFARYYFNNGIFAEATVGIGSSKVSSTFGDIEASIFALRGSAGYAFFLGDHVAIEPAINYTHQTQKPKDSAVDGKTILSTIFFSVGFTAYF
ncbi:outer membrane beta-barrel protein [Lacinutrix chionoecetis]